jgi:hypothetical protein
VPVLVPDHALPSGLLTQSGWQCERGYLQQGNACVEVKVPANAFLDDMGHDWQCERGFRRQKNACVQIHLPSFAYLDYSGNAWTCEAGFESAGDRCVPDNLNQSRVAEDDAVEKFGRSRERPCEYPQLQPVVCSRTRHAPVGS